MNVQVVMTRVSDLHPYANNPRNNEEAVEKVALSIATFGFLVPIVAKPDGEILAGHTRYAASLRLGLKEVPVIIAEDLDEAKAKAFRLADNKVSEAATWDLAKLEEELDDLRGLDDIDLNGLGFDDDDIADTDVDSFFEDSPTPKREKKVNTVKCPHCGEEFEVE